MVLSFWISFAVTLALFGAAAVTGRLGRRKLHFVLAPAAIAMLTVTIILTERLVRALDFPKHQLAIHLAIAKTAAALVVVAAGTGVVTAFRPRFRVVHRTFVVLFLIATVVATGTGIWMFSIATPR